MQTEKRLCERFNTSESLCNVVQTNNTGQCNAAEDAHEKLAGLYIWWGHYLAGLLVQGNPERLPSAAQGNNPTAKALKMSTVLLVYYEKTIIYQILASVVQSVIMQKGLN